MAACFQEVERLPALVLTGAKDRRAPALQGRDWGLRSCDDEPLAAYHAGLPRSNNFFTCIRHPAPLNIQATGMPCAQCLVLTMCLV